MLGGGRNGQQRGGGEPDNGAVPTGNWLSCTVCLALLLAAAACYQLMFQLREESCFAAAHHCCLLLSAVAPGMMGMPSLKWSDLKNSCTMWFE